MVAPSLSKTFTLEEYLNCEHDFEKPYELIAGKIVEMPPESFQNVRAALYLLMLLAKEIGLRRVSNKAEIIISGSKVTSRVPDLTVFSESGATELEKRSRSTIDLDMLPPELVVEVVSLGKANRDRDYRYKRSEYAARGIAHYWIIDPQYGTMTCLELIDGLYEEQIFKGDSARVIKPIDLEINFKELFVDHS